MNNEVNELRAELLREKLANQELANSLQKEKEKSILLEKSLGSLRKSYETFHNQAEMEEEKFVNKVSVCINGSFPCWNPKILILLLCFDS